MPNHDLVAEGRKLLAQAERLPMRVESIQVAVRSLASDVLDELEKVRARNAALEQGSVLGYVLVLKDDDDELTCLASVFGLDEMRVAEGIGSAYASRGERYLIAELREVSDRG